MKHENPSWLTVIFLIGYLAGIGTSIVMVIYSVVLNRPASAALFAATAYLLALGAARIEIAK